MTGVTTSTATSSLLLPGIRRLTILDDRGRIRRFRPNPGQLMFLQSVEDQFKDRGYARNIILKARQIGFSTMIGAVGYQLCHLFDNYFGLVMAHDRETGGNLLGMVKRYRAYDPFAPLYPLKSDSKATLEWEHNNSWLNVATAGNRETGRGTTKRFIHQSEAAFYPDPKRTINALKNAIHPVPSTFMAIESTANGVGNAFHTEWEMAVAGETMFVPLFFAWHQHEVYRATAIGISPVIASYTEDERVLRRLGIDDDQLAWRRWKIRDLGGDLLQFHQEFPADPEEAFLSTGTNAFPADALKAHYVPDAGYRGLLIEDHEGVKFKASADGHLVVFKAPSRDMEFGEYVIGADPTNTTRGDYAVAQVVNRRTLEQVAVMRLRCDAVEFGKHLYRLGEYYNFATVGPEVEGPGGLTIGTLQGLAYPNIYMRAEKLDKTPGKLTGSQWGWSTSLQTKHIAVGYGINALTQSSLLIHDPITYKEMKNYVTLPNGGYGNGDGSPNDDTVMALLIALAIHFTDAPPLGYGQQTHGVTTNMQLADTVKASDYMQRLGLTAEQAAAVPGLQNDLQDHFPDDLYGTIEQVEYDEDY